MRLHIVDVFQSLSDVGHLLIDACQVQQEVPMTMEACSIMEVNLRAPACCMRLAAPAALAGIGIITWLNPLCGITMLLATLQNHTIHH